MESDNARRCGVSSVHGRANRKGKESIKDYVSKDRCQLRLLSQLSAEGQTKYDLGQQSLGSWETPGRKKR